ncbi:hypothetical protein [Streptomyces atratus]
MTEVAVFEVITADLVPNFTALALARSVPVTATVVPPSGDGTRS